MHRRYGLLILLTALIVLAGAYDAVRGVQPSGFRGLPFSVQVIDAYTAIIEPVPGIPLPASLHSGDHIELPALSPASRIAIDLPLNLATLPSGRTYALVIRRDGARVTFPITSVSSNALTGSSVPRWVAFCFIVLLSAIALLAVWRGRDLAAAGLVLWAVAFLTGMAMNAVPSDGTLGLGLMLGANMIFLLARVGFYMMAESMVASVLGPRARTWWRAGFLLLLGFGAIRALVGPLAFVATGWAELLRPGYGLALTASYLVPVALLFVSYRRAEAAQRLRLRWMLGSSMVFLAGIFINNTWILGFFASLVAWHFMFAIAMAGFLYAILRHRVVDVTVALNHALVYAATTSLVLGLFALFESLVERIAVGERASLLLELLVPLALGASLATVHRRIDALVERLVFRRQYLQESSLRRFAREAAFVNAPDSLLQLTVTQMQRHVGAPWVALYENTPQGYALARQSGDHALPTQIGVDDPALITLRAHEPAVDLHGRASDLGSEGYGFPLQVRGQLLGVLVVGPRPGEHYSSEERALFAHVAHEVGAALFAVRAQISEQHLIESRLREATLLDALRASRQPQPG